MLAETKIKDMEQLSAQIATLEDKLNAALSAQQAAEKKAEEMATSQKNLTNH
jgi:outer membrane murein-binding lipoprotein Lpp